MNTTPRSADLLIGSNGNNSNAPVIGNNRNAPAIPGTAPTPDALLHILHTGTWHSRGYLPHFESPTAIQHVTFHLYDSLPAAAVRRMHNELQRIPVEYQDPERRKRVQAWMDAGYGSCILRKPAIAEMVQSTLLHYDAQRYRLIAWVVMPNHVHTLFQPIDGWTMAKTVASWKKFTARKICDARRSGEIEPGGTPIWHREYWDTFIRNERHLARAIGYIHANPVKARLVQRAEDWRWSSGFGGG